MVCPHAAIRSKLISKEELADMDNDIIEGVDGALLNIGVDVASRVADGDYAVQLKNVKIGSEITVSIPALEKELTMKVYYIKDKGSFAVWKATKASGQYDQKTFEVKARPTEKLDGVRPGMSVILKK